MAVSMKRSRESTKALVKEVCVSIVQICCEDRCVSTSFLLDYDPCYFVQREYFRTFKVLLLLLDIQSNVVHLNFCSGGMTIPQPPTCCCCQRSRRANLSACALNQLPVMNPALPCTREYRSAKRLYPVSLQQDTLLKCLPHYLVYFTVIVFQFQMLL